MVETGHPAAGRPYGPGIRPIPAEPPRELGGFRFARIFDGFERYEPPPVPHIDPARRVDDPTRRDRILAYLRGCSPLLRSDVVTYDWFAPDAGMVVPQSWFTDGIWIWPEALAYYLDRHWFGPEPGLRERIVKRRYVPPRVRPKTLAAAAEALDEWRTARRRLYRPSQHRPLVPADTDPLVRGEESNEPPTAADYAAVDRVFEGGYDRFSRQVATTLQASWWLPGRDVTARVEGWLAAYCGRTSDLDGSRYQDFPAARRVLAEFGLLDIEVPDWGEEVAVSDIHFQPLADSWREPARYRALERRLGARVFPVGRIDADDLVVAEDGQVFLAGDGGADWVGTSIEDALERLIRGLTADQLG